MKSEFSNVRSELYKKALREFPEARKEDIKAMERFLSPQPDEVIVEVGAGSGFFSSEIAAKCSFLFVTDPSQEQLDGIEGDNISLQEASPEKISVPENSVDAVWSFGAMHHSFQKQNSFHNFYKILKKGGRVVIGDVFAGSSLAKHFDDCVTKYCDTGHEVSFWSDEYAKSISAVAGFSKIEIHELPQKWWFNSKDEIAQFMYDIHAMVKTDKDTVLEGVENILGIKMEGEKYYINWPMKMIVLTK